MYYIDVLKHINQITLIFHRFGIWHSDTRTNFRIGVSKIVHLVPFVYYVVSAITATILNDDPNGFILLLVVSIGAFVLLVRLYYVLWKQDQFVKLISKVGAHSFTHIEQFNQVNGKIQIFMKFVVCLEIVVVFAIILMITTALPTFSKSKRLPLNIYFPVDWKHNELFYWMTFVIVMYFLIMCLVYTLTNVIVWYLMFSLAIKFQILETKFKNLGIVRKMMLVRERQNLFYTDLIGLIKDHRTIQKWQHYSSALIMDPIQMHLSTLIMFFFPYIRTTEEFKSCFSMLFFIQLATSSLSLCSSVYLLAFTPVENPLQFGVNIVIIMFNFFDIFVLTHLGNEIKLSSSRLSYCLFECNWIDQSESYKKSIFMLMEVLKRSQELVIGKLYPLDYEILTQILKLAYSMFNILRNLK